MSDRRLPVGIQSFNEIRKEGYLYVDKTDLIWKLANKGKKYNYLSRPRRFGKSVLVDTLQAYFEGKKGLFEGLRIMDMEKNWTCRPVVRLDMSRGGPVQRKFGLILTVLLRNTKRSMPSPSNLLIPWQTGFMPSSLPLTDRRASKLRYLSTNTMLRCSTPGRHWNMRGVLPFIAVCLPS